jgi:maltooligosyltrehalose trehalohydrolase
MNAGMRFGPQITPEDITFRLWAPAAKRVDLMLDRPRPMQARPDGWYEVTIAGARAGTRYQYRIDNDIVVPDPASHFQPEDVFGPSEIIDHTQYQWRANWRGRAWQDAAMLELHVGTFTPSGTFAGVIDKLDHVCETGLTAIELMPIADFAGRWNWGYDGVLLYAPDSTYGRPDDLKRLIDAAHLRGLMVFLDVVYNHFGPEGNYLGRYAPSFFTSAHTPWGSAIDYRVPQVRAFAIENALHWLQHYRFDGLRLDAVHAIVEPGEPPFLHELSRTVGEFAVKSGRAIHLIVENDDNRVALIDPETASPRGKYRAQWNDDYHHAWHVLLTGEHTGYYGDYADDPHRHLARALSCGFAYQGEPSGHRGGRRRGESSADLPPIAFVNFLQNHDQIGNRPFGDRLSTQTQSAALEAALAITLLAPMPPLMFMGEEWGSTTPFAFFCDFAGPLADAVRSGRRAEFKAAYERFGAEIPDPLAEQTFRSAVLDWHERMGANGCARLNLVRRLLLARQADIAPHLAGARFGPAAVRSDGAVIWACWRLANASELRLLANLTAAAVPRPAACTVGRPIWGGPPPEVLSPWSVFWSIGVP